MTTKKPLPATRRTYGQTSTGQVIDDAMIREFAAEAERGYTPEQVMRRGRGRPPLGDGAKRGSSVRLDPVQRAEAARVAKTLGVTVSDVVRTALAEYLKAATVPRPKRVAVTGKVTSRKAAAAASKVLKNPGARAEPKPAGAASALVKGAKTSAAKRAPRKVQRSA